MKISDLGEFGLIDQIRKLSREKDAVIGIGDDAAALKIPGSRIVLVTTDLLLEHVHFDLSYTDYYSLGWKSAAVNLSDIAAMGGTPRYCLTALGIPVKMKPDQVFDFYRGFNKLLRAYKTVLVGGDTCSSRHGFFISVTALGEAKRYRMIKRSGARPGDRIFVTGTLGDSAAGLELLQSGIAAFRSRNKDAKIDNQRSESRQLVEKHVRPVPRVEWGRKIAAYASSMIDISDGLSSDLFHICEGSGVGADISADRIPISAALKKMSATLSKSSLAYALAGGEDYELLFTVPEKFVQKVSSLKLPITEIGRVTRARTIFLTDSSGKRKAMQREGYDHFRS